MPSTPLFSVLGDLLDDDEADVESPEGFGAGDEFDDEDSALDEVVADAVDEAFGGIEDEAFEDDFDDDEDEREDKAAVPVPSPGSSFSKGSRLGMAKAARRSIFSGDLGAVYALGFRDAIAHAGGDDDLAEETYGSLLALLAPAVVPFVQGASGSDPAAPPDDTFRDIGRKVGEALGLRKRAKKPRASPVPTVNPAGGLREEVPAVPVEASADALPPVYVADSIEARKVVDGLGDDVHSAISGQVPLQEAFGATVHHGWVSSMRRDRAKDAVVSAIKSGESRLRLAPSDAVAAFAEDVEAEPLLYADGTAWDAIYGRLSAVPCPSCGSVHPEAAFGGVAKDCGVCHGYGAILIPEDDLSMYASALKYDVLLPPSEADLVQGRFLLPTR